MRTHNPDYLEAALHTLLVTFSLLFPLISTNEKAIFQRMHQYEVRNKLQITYMY